MTLARRLLALPVVLLLAGGALAGCATTSGGTPSASTASESATATDDPDLTAAWLDDGRMIGIVTLGSSTCVPMADEATLESDGSLSVTLVEPDAATACTRDLVPRATLVSVPEGVDPSKDLSITVSGDNDYKATTELEGVEGLAGDGETDYLPSAGWTGTDGQFVILTWGSSTCVPTLEDSVASGPAEVTVTFATPAEAQVCTADMAARGVVSGVIDLEESSDVTLILTGGPEFDDVQVPIYGTN